MLKYQILFVWNPNYINDISEIILLFSLTINIFLLNRRKVMRLMTIVILVFAVSIFAQISVEGPSGIVIQMDTSKGLIAFGDTSGRKLTYNFDYPWTRGGNFAVFAVDEAGFTNLPGEVMFGFENLSGNPGGSGYYMGTLSKNWRVPHGAGALFFQISVTPVELDGAGVGRISLYIFNSDVIPHQIGGMLGIDLKIGNNDSPPLTTSTNVLSVGTLLNEDYMPYFWQAFEISPGAGCEQVIARGYLKGLGAISPDRFALGDLLFLGLHPWEFDSSFIDVPYHDSAIILRWPKENVNPDKSVEFITYFGFGRCITSAMDILLFPMIPAELIANCDEIDAPFEAAVLVHNISLMAGLTDGEVCISLPDGVSLEFDPLHPDEPCLPLSVDPMLPESSAVTAWLVDIDDTALWGDSIMITLTLTGEPAVSITETSWVYIPNPDGNLPLCALNFPYRYLGCPDSASIVIPFYLWDDSGIDRLSVATKLGDHILLSISGYVSFTEESLFVVVPEWAMVHCDTLPLQLISATDIYGCSPAEFPPVETLFVDLYSPNFHGFIPPGGASCPQIPVIRMFIVDEPAGVNPMSIEIRFDGVDIPPDDPRISWEEDTILVFTSSDTFPIGYPLTICLMSVADNTDLCGPHVTETPFCATYTVSAIDEAIKMPERPSLWAAPNPFNATCEISLFLPQPGEVCIYIQDIFGRYVATIEHNKFMSGTYKFHWKPSIKTPSGVYLISADFNRQKIVYRALYVK